MNTDFFGIETTLKMRKDRPSHWLITMLVDVDSTDFSNGKAKSQDWQAGGYV